MPAVRMVVAVSPVDDAYSAAPVDEKKSAVDESSTPVDESDTMSVVASVKSWVAADASRRNSEPRFVGATGGGGLAVTRHWSDARLASVASSSLTASMVWIGCVPVGWWRWRPLLSSPLLFFRCTWLGERLAAGCSQRKGAGTKGGSRRRRERRNGGSRREKVMRAHVDGVWAERSPDSLHSLVAICLSPVRRLARARARRVIFGRPRSRSRLHTAQPTTR